MSEYLVHISLAILGSYGIATMISDYEGPFGLFEKLRATKVGRLFNCSVCLLPYLALLPSIYFGLGLFGYLAVMGAGVIIARLT